MTHPIVVPMDDHALPMNNLQTMSPSPSNSLNHNLSIAFSRIYDQIESLKQTQAQNHLQALADLERTVRITNAGVADQVRQAVNEGITGMVQQVVRQAVNESMGMIVQNAVRQAMHGIIFSVNHTDGNMQAQAQPLSQQQQQSQLAHPQSQPPNGAPNSNTNNVRATPQGWGMPPAVNGYMSAPNVGVPPSSDPASLPNTLHSSLFNFAQGSASTPTLPSSHTHPHQQHAHQPSQPASHAPPPSQPPGGHAQTNSQASTSQTYPSPGSPISGFTMSREVKTVPDLWREYTVGLEGQPPVRSVYEVSEKKRKKGKRFKDDSERKFYRRRKRVLDLVEALIKKGIPEDQAAKRVERLREDRKVTLNKLGEIIPELSPEELAMI
ncbi:hypothetical protein AYX13_03211 [Cryptococcus neoformans]|nr:hypothetical protein AYX13_03211 [Cryptococcus neoformans var. grubii]